ncbi:MAG TPA: ATP-binding protein [Burkholderiales bacterium]
MPDQAQLPANPPGTALLPVPASLRRLNFRLALWSVGSLVIVATATVQVYDVFRRLEIVVETTQQSYANLVRTLSEQTAGTLQVIDVVLQDTVANQSLDLRRLSDEGLNQRLRDRVLATPHIGELLVIDANGRLVANSGKAPPQRTSWVSQDFFLAHRNGDRGLHVSQATHHDKPAIVLSRRIDGSDGKFLGVAVAFLDLEYFRRSYASIKLEPGSEIDLLRSNGGLLVRYPDASGRKQLPFSEQGIFENLLARGQAVALLANPIDGQDQIYAARPVEGHPFAIAASVPRAAVVAPWRTQVIHSTVRTTLLCLSVALLMWLVLRELKRRELAEDGLRVQTALLDELFESAPEAIVMLDAQQRVIRVNREFSAVFGYAAGEAVGRPLDDLIVPDDLRQESARMARAASMGQRAGGETERVRKDGHRLPVSALVAPIMTPAGRIATYAIYRDISERRLAESERSRLELRLRHGEKLEAIGTMAGGIAHDFNNILASILGYGDMAFNAAPDTGPLKRYVANVMSASHRARSLVDQILSYGRSTRGRHEVVNAASLLEETLELVRASLPPNIELDVALTAKEATVVADPTHIHQVAMNLCTNAIHAMDAGGTLSVKLEEATATEPKTLSHGQLPPGTYVILTVRDSGRGIDASIMGRIFEPFFTTKESGTGTGLGLAMVQSIVNELGGMIHVASEQGKGSTFEIYLPRSDAEAMKKSEQDLPLPRGKGERVLVVDDERPLMLLTEEMLAALNYEPAGFTRPAEALLELQAGPQRFDAAVIDHLMPGMTGTDLVKQLRAVRPDLPVLLVSAYTGPVLNQEALTAGVDEILSKPLDFRRLAQTMSQILSRAAVR